MFRVIFSNSEDWLDSSILGYIMRIFREFSAGIPVRALVAQLLSSSNDLLDVMSGNVNSNDINGDLLIKSKIEDDSGARPLSFVMDVS